MLKPDRVVVVNSTGFSKNKTQHWEWYDNFTGYRVDGFPSNREVKVFLRDITHVFMVENPLNFFLLEYAKKNNIKVFIQTNPEFCDHLNQDLPLPHRFLMPSKWMLEEFKQRFGVVTYLPPPINPQEFAEARNVNFNREGKPKFLHVVGTLAAHDRNGTLDLLASLPKTQASFELVIRSQHPLPEEYMTADHRVKYIIENSPLEEVYKDYDAVLLPRRYGGLSLVCNEALMSGLPVIMPDISPNEFLPKEWLVPATKKGSFFARTHVDIYQSDFSEKIDWLCQQDFNALKSQAFDIGYTNFSEQLLKPKYEALLQ
jgi:glycosyltransferase involved in cell wall biosynthesis